MSWIGAPGCREEGLPMKMLAYGALALTGFSALADPAIVGFDASRGGLFSLSQGGALTALRTAILTAYPSATIGGVSALSAPGLAGADIALLASTTGGISAITPLSASEQTALNSFVLAGRGAVIFTDNDSFAGAGSQPANLSLLAPFGMTCNGTGLGWQRFATVSDPHASPVTDGPFGLCQSFSVGWSGWFNVLGSATSLATLNDNGQAALAVIPRGALGPGSGAVVLFSDCTMIGDGYFPAANQALVLNAIAFAAEPGCAGDLNADGLVDDADFSLFVVAYNLLDCADGSMPAGCPSDFNRDGFVDDADFGIFVVSYNELVCP